MTTTFYSFLAMFEKVFARCDGDGEEILCLHIVFRHFLLVTATNSSSSSSSKKKGEDLCSGNRGG